MAVHAAFAKSRKGVEIQEATPKLMVYAALGHQNHVAFKEDADARRPVNCPSSYLTPHLQSKASCEVKNIAMISQEHVLKTRKWFPRRMDSRKHPHSQTSYLSVHSQSKAPCEVTRHRNSSSRSMDSRRHRTGSNTHLIARSQSKVPCEVTWDRNSFPWGMVQEDTGMAQTHI